MRFHLLLAFLLLFTLGAKAQFAPPPPQVNPSATENKPWEKVSDKLKKQLGLDKTQKQQLSDIYERYYNDVAQYVNMSDADIKENRKHGASDEARVNNPNIAKLVNARNLQIKKILSPDQYQHFLPLSKPYDIIGYHPGDEDQVYQD